ncbi:hypothetical protein ACLK10_22405 [Escherichia coli]
MAYITLSSFRVNPEFQDFSLQPNRLFREVIHIRRVDGGALWGFSAGRNRKIAEKSLTAAFPSKTPLYTFLRTELSTIINVISVFFPR